LSISGPGASFARSGSSPEEAIVEVGQAGDRREAEPGVLHIRAEAVAGDDRDVVAAPGELPTAVTARW
jgi:hypothetical protein